MTLLQTKDRMISRNTILYGPHKAPSQYTLIWCTVPYGLEIISVMFPYFKKQFETPCIKLMIFSKVSDEFSDITIVLEFFKWTIQLHRSLQFLPIEVVYVKRTVYRARFWRQNRPSVAL